MCSGYCDGSCGHVSIDDGPVSVKKEGREGGEKGREGRGEKGEGEGGEGKRGRTGRGWETSYDDIYKMGCEFINSLTWTEAGSHAQ